MALRFFFSCAIAAAITCFPATSIHAQNELLSEAFDDAALPDGWSQQTLSDDSGWIGGDNTGLQSDWWDIAPHGDFIATNDDECDCDKSADYLIMPPLNLAAVEGLLLSFASYFSGELFEGSTEVATIEYSLDEGESWTVLQTVEGNGNSDNTVWESVSVNLSSLAGNANVLVAFRYNDDGGWMFGWGIDDVLLYEPQGLDAELTSLSMASNANLGSELDVVGLITNAGADLIQSLDVTWNSGGQDHVQGFSDLNLAMGESFAFTHQDVFVAATMGNNDIEVGISNVNGTGDDNTDNNTLIAGVMVIEYGSISSGTYEREYIYYHPGNAPANCPLVFVCHGYSGSAAGIMNYSDFNSLADEFGFAVCYPQGIEDSDGYTFFNVGYDFQNNETVDDVAFLEELTNLFVAENAVDPDKVFCTGMSNGGDLCYLLACEASETFAGVAPVAGMIMQDIMDVCSPSETVGILEIHGTEDNVTYFNGDPQNQDNWGAYPSIPATVDFWVNLYGIGLIESGTFSDIAPNDGSTVVYDKYGLDGDCGEVWLYTVQGGGHDWPGSYGNMDIDSSREAWLFFEQLCSETIGVDDLDAPSERGPLVQVVDVLGRTLDQTSATPGALLFYIYENGAVEKVILGRDQ
jgi:polyhydroxybutyrate depolymerase